MARLFVLLAILVLALVAARWYLPIGPAQAIDGDTLEVGRQRIHLYGIEAGPEGRFCGMLPCGHLAQRELARLVQDRYVFCLPYDRDSEGVYRGACWAGWTDLGDAMARAGVVTAHPRRGIMYGEAERSAREEARGLWGQAPSPQPHLTPLSPSPTGGG